MKTLIRLVALSFALTAGLTQAADAEKKAPTPAQAAQQEKMKACNKEAADKKLAGDARKAFMKDCLSAKPAAAEGDKAATPAQAAQQEKMKACNKEAGDKKLEGDARKAFMKDCLSAKPAAAPKAEKK